MSTEILSGRSLAAEIREHTAQEVENLKANGINPTLAVLVATDDESTEYYVRHIVKAGEKTGVNVAVTRLENNSTQENLASEISRMADDSSIHGVILQTPLPDGVDPNALRALIPPEKDVDGANPLSAGRLITGVDAFAPTTAVAVMELLARYDLSTSGTHAVIIGRSLVVGKPLAHLLLAKDATVTICHSKTRDLSQICSQADILIAAVGRPHMITAEYVKQGAVVIDVGTNVLDDGSLVGDVNSQSIQEKAGAFSPVPGGIGPVTTALLLKQVIAAASLTN